MCGKAANTRGEGGGGGGEEAEHLKKAPKAAQVVLEASVFFPQLRFPRVQLLVLRTMLNRL